MGQFNLPGTSSLQQHSQPYPVGLGSADAIAASSGENQQAEEELFADTEPQHDEAEELFGKHASAFTVSGHVHGQVSVYGLTYSCNVPPSDITQHIRLQACTLHRAMLSC